MTDSRVVVGWWTTVIDGQTTLGLEPAATKFQAQATSNEFLREHNPAFRCTDARPATSAEIDRWIVLYDRTAKDPDKPKPPSWATAKREMLRQQYGTPTPTPDPVPQEGPLTEARPIWSRRPDPHQTTATEATWHTLTMYATATLYLTAIATVCWTLTLLLWPNWQTILLTITAIGMTAATFAAEWLNRLDQQEVTPMLKWCPHCQQTVPKRHRHRTPRDYTDEHNRRTILKAWRADHGGWCPGTQHCTPEGHPSQDLTVDHHTPQAHGGTLNDGWRVICRTANSTRGTKPLGG